MNVDAPEELSAALRKRQKQATPDKGGCNAFFWLIDGSGPNPSPYGNYLIHAHGLAASDGWLIVSIDNLVARVDHVMIRPQGRSRRGPQMSATPRQHVHQSRATHSRSATSACRVQSRA